MPLLGNKKQSEVLWDVKTDVSPYTTLLVLADDFVSAGKKAIRIAKREVIGRRKPVVTSIERRGTIDAF